MHRLSRNKRSFQRMALPNPAVPTPQDNRSLAQAVLGDGRPLLLFSGLMLFVAGAFGVFQAATGHFLPHDEAYLGMSAQELCAFYDCRILRFMIHDRVAFGGALGGVGILYLWLAEFPLRRGESWAWWAFLLSGAAGFLSFLSFLGYGYLDTWHGVATLFLFPCFVAGLWRSYTGAYAMFPLEWKSLLTLSRMWRAHTGLADLCLAMTATGLLSAGAVIVFGGMTRVFVPEDLAYMALTVENLHGISERLVPLIAHDRVAFGGALFCTGILMAFAVLFAQRTRNLWEVLFLAGSLGFLSAIGVHFVVGYVNWFHLLPAYLAATVFYTGMALSYPRATGKPTAQ